MTVMINGTEVEAPEGAVAYKYADPTENARWILRRERSSGASGG